LYRRIEPRKHRGICCSESSLSVVVEVLRVHPSLGIVLNYLNTNRVSLDSNDALDSVIKRESRHALVGFRKPPLV
jgi:hypothetical protein